MGGASSWWRWSRAGEATEETCVSATVTVAEDVGKIGLQLTDSLKLRLANDARRS
jgi:hypothetical protein